MTNLNNPAGRLRYWLERARAEVEPGEAALYGWGDLFGIEYDTSRGRVEIVGRGSELMDLATSTRAAMGALPPELHGDALIADFGEVEQCLGNFLNIPRMSMQQFLQPIEKTGWRSLELADRYLSTHRPERWVSDANQDKLLTKVREAIDAALDSEDLTAHAREIVVKRLRQVEEAILECRLKGVDAIEERIDSLTAVILRRADMTIEFFTTPTGKVIGGLIGAVLLTLGLDAGFLALPGPEGQPPALEQTVEVDVNVDVATNRDGPSGEGADSDVVDAELVEDGPEAPSGAQE